ncbi:MAG: glycosyltransferase family 39 protein [bacterium]|nr:MAG: glycosyltransferase family 39 protein [bacterium]
MSNVAILVCLALIKLLIHVLTNGQYGFHRDEFLYMAMGNHLDWGYVELPPGVGAVAHFSNGLIGDSIFAVRFFPALVGAGIVMLIGLMVRELGGKRYAQILSGLAFIISPAYLRSNTLFQPVSFDQFFWVLSAYLFIKILKKDDPKRWLVLGLVMGLGLMNKYTMLLFGFGLLMSIVLTSHRRMLITKWPWIAGFTAFIIFFPNLIWQHNHNWVFFEFIRELSKQQFVNVQPADFIIGQILMNMQALPIWIIGLYYYIFSRDGKPYRPLGLMYIIFLVVLLIARGKAYYLLPAYPMLFAAGSCEIEKYITQMNWNWLKPAIVISMIIISIGVIPYGLPILPVETFQKYAKFMSENLGLSGPLRWETGKIHSLPQDYADMFGWENQVATVANVYHRLSPEEKKKCVIFASNYGEAGAIDYYGKRYDLPKAINVSGSYYTWGPGSLPAEILITIGLSEDVFDNWYEEVELVTTITHEYARENNVPVHIARKPQISLQDLWPRLAKYRF